MSEYERLYATMVKRWWGLEVGAVEKDVGGEGEDDRVALRVDEEVVVELLEKSRQLSRV